MAYESMEKHFASFQRGEEKGFSYFFNEYCQAVTSFASNIIGDTENARDIVEDSFVKLWEKRETIERAGAIKSYLYTIVKNACIDHLAKKKKEALVLGEVGRMEELTPTFFIEVVRSEVNQLLAEALNGLSEKKGVIIQLFYSQGKSINEIADELHLSPHTVRNQKAAAIDIMRKAFNKANPSPFYKEEN